MIAWFAGLAVLVALIAFNDPGRLLHGVVAIGWWLIAIFAWHAVPLTLDARAWQLLFSRRPALPPLLAAIWIGEGVNGLFPIPHLGEIARARIARHAAQPGEAAATVVVDLTLSISTELVFALIGVTLLSMVSSKLGAVRVLAPAGAVVAGSALIFYLLQRAGLFALAVRIAHRWSDAARRLFDVDSAAALDAAVQGIYQRRRPLIQSAAWRLAGWLAGAGETWLVFYALGQPIGIGEAIVIEKPRPCRPHRRLRDSGRPRGSRRRAAPARQRNGARARGWFGAGADEAVARNGIGVAGAGHRLSPVRAAAAPPADAGDRPQQQFVSRREPLAPGNMLRHIIPRQMLPLTQGR